LAAGDLRRLGGVTRSCCAGAPREWSVELAPGSVTGERLAVLRELGVTRVSLGAQSFQPALLEALGRRHSVAQIHRAYERIRAAGFACVNLDLMFALPGQGEGAWLADLRAAVAMRPEHISAYCLTVEEDTALWARLARGGARRDREREAAFYERAWGELEGAGFAQYEISNFARPGHECRHNLNTWRMGSWLGLGPSAASQHGGWRGANPADLEAWLAGLARGRRAEVERVALTEGLLAEDALIFGLRLNAGVDLGALRGRHPGADWAAAEAFAVRLEGEGLAEREGGRLRLTLRGRLVADAIGAEALGVLSGKGE
jgi:oxygen-independent coproporphyrinogen-3 oxidase